MNLPPHAELVLSAFAQSTHPSSCKAEVQVWFERKGEEAERRALQARQNAIAGAAVVRAGIRRAIGPWPANGVRPKVEWVLSAIEMNGLTTYGLRRVPDRGTVADEIGAMAIAWEATSLSGDRLFVGCDSSASTS
jgi:hypothetical protein